MDENQGSRYLAALHETLGRIGNPVLHVIKADSRAQCSERAQELRKKPQWSLSDAVRLSFYEVEANADLHRQDELVMKAAARLNACLIKLRHEGTDHLWALFGIKPNTPEAEVIKAKEMAATLLHEAQRIQEEMEAKLNEARVSLDEAHHNHQAAMEIERAEKEALVAELQNAKQDLEKLRTELQTALTPQVIKAFDNAVTDAGATKELAAARILIEQQQRLIEKFQAAPKFDEEIKEALESLAKNFDDPARKVETKHTIYFLLNSILGK